MGTAYEQNGHTNNTASAPPVSADHLADLRKSALTDDTIVAAGLHTEPDPVRNGQLLDWPGPAAILGPCLVIPYANADGSRNCYARLKPSRPRMDDKGKPIKYEGPRKKGNRVYFPPRTVAVLNDPTQALVITEGEKKALCADQFGFRCVGIPGVYAWQRKRQRKDGKPVGPRLLIPDFDGILLAGRAVYIVFDSDAATNPNVRWAEWHFAQALRARGAKVKVVRLPGGPPDAAGVPGKIGLDDFFAQNGPHAADALRGLMKAARAPSKPPRAPQAKAATATAAQPAGEHETDLGNARRMVAGHGPDLLFCHPWNSWLAWDGNCRWAVDDTAEAERRAKATAGAMYQAAADRIRAVVDKIKDATDEEKIALGKELASANRALKWALESEERKPLSAMMHLAASEPGIPVRPDQLDADRWALNCPNGVVDLRTGTLRPARREDLFTKLCPTRFDPDAACPTWERFLLAVFAGSVEMVRYARRVLGYCLTGDVREQALFFCHGGGSNGKGTLLNTVLSVVGHDYAMTAPAELLMQRYGEAHPTERADLHGKRLVVVSENQQGSRLNEGLVKQLTGGDPIRARKMRQDFFEFLPTHKLVLVGNHKPKVAGTDHAIWRRLRLIPFAVRFWNADEKPAPGESRPPELQQDKTLADRLQAEAVGILSWLVAGALDWQQGGLGMPPDVAKATASYRQEQDLIGGFLDERCLTGAKYTVKAGALYKAFRQWCDDAGERHVPTQRDFGMAMTERGFERFTNNGTCYRGVMLQGPSTEGTEPDGT